MSQRGFGDADSMFNRADLLLGDFLQDVAMQLMPLLVADFFAAEGHRIQAAVQIEISILSSLIRLARSDRGSRITCAAYFCLFTSGGACVLVATRIFVRQ